MRRTRSGGHYPHTVSSVYAMRWQAERGGAGGGGEKEGGGGKHAPPLRAGGDGCFLNLVVAVQWPGPNLLVGGDDVHASPKPRLVLGCPLHRHNHAGVNTHTRKPDHYLRQRTRIACEFTNSGQLDSARE